LNSHAIDKPYANALNLTTDRVNSITIAKEIRIKYADTNKNKYKERAWRENKSLENKNSLWYRLVFVVVILCVVATTPAPFREE